MATKRKPGADQAVIEATRMSIVRRLVRRGVSRRVAGAVVGWSLATVKRKLKRPSGGERRAMEAVGLDAAE